MAQTRIGISGWTYGPWRGTFYPKGLPHKRELEFAGRHVNSIEINGSFYSLQTPKSFQTWYEQTPNDFVFAVKGSRFITHMKKLRDVHAPLANFFASGLLRLNEKLGPVLWQFPPQMPFDENKFAAFFDMLPRDMDVAAKLARKHDDRVRGRSWLKAEVDQPIRYAVEIRHESFKDAAFIKLLRRHKIALVFADTAGKWPYMEDVTADFVYARLHGDTELYVSGYDDTALDWWANRLCRWRDGGEPSDPKCISSVAARRRKSRDVYIYFDNDVKVRAPFDAMNLAKRLVEKPCETLAVPTLLAHVAELPRANWPGFHSRRRAAV